MALIQVDQPASGVTRLLINRPEKRNAMDFDTRQALIEALRAVPADPQCRAVVFGGVEQVFSAGGDLPSMVNNTETQARERMQHVAVACRLIADLRVPFVSAAEGFCAGAAVGLALLGDEIIVGHKSRILFPFLKLGLVPDWALLHTLPSRVGLSQARRILTAGKPVGGEASVRIGLADELAADEDVMDVAVARATSLAQLSPSAFAAMKQRLMSPSASLEEDLRREEDDQAALLTGPDFKEGYSAFMEKREPRFRSGGETS